MLTGKTNKPTLILWIIFGSMTGFFTFMEGKTAIAIVITITVIYAILELLGLLHKKIL